jgi:uncharacterized protein (DUF305 family)
MEKNKTLIIAASVLVAGFFIGYCLGLNRPISADMHRMPDGSMMANNGDMQGMMMDMNAGLRGKAGDEFDRAFLSEMIVHHEGAVEMAQAALQSAKHQEIKDMARDIIFAQTSEIAQMRSWLKSWYNQ